MLKGRTYYSERIKGERGNYNWPARFDLTNGFVGVTQFDGDEVKDRILLSPKQVRELNAFLGQKRTSR